MTRNGKPKLVLYVQVEDEYGQKRLKARVMAEQPDGELHYVQWAYGGYGPGAEYDGLEISAYVGDHPDWDSTQHFRGVWGSGVHYQPHRIENARHAKAIALVFARIERGLERITQDDGSLADAEYASLVLRVARVLKISAVHVRNPRAVRDRSGRTHQRVNGPGLQSWVASATEGIKEGKASEHVR
jgi:hypothetical protein